MKLQSLHLILENLRKVLRQQNWNLGTSPQNITVDGVWQGLFLKRKTTFKALNKDVQPSFLSPPPKGTKTPHNGVGQAEGSLPKCSLGSVKSLVDCEF